MLQIHSKAMSSLIVMAAIVLHDPAGLHAEMGPAAPRGLSKLIVYMADGLYDPLAPNPDPRMKNCDPVLNMCDGDYFQTEILDRSPAQMAQSEADAKAFFRQRFGIDVDAPAMRARLMYRMFQIDPRVNYHVVAASGASVPPAGWPVHFGGWIVVVTDPGGIDLGGEFPGAHTGFGGMFIYGENVIDNSLGARGRHHARGQLPVIHYQSSQPPFVPPPGPSGVGDSAIMFRLELSNERLGSGLARGRGEIIPRPDGRIEMDIVSVLTFPGSSHTMETD